MLLQEAGLLRKLSRSHPLMVDSGSDHLPAGFAAEHHLHCGEIIGGLGFRYGMAG
jgi:hypothetical protein